MTSTRNVIPRDPVTGEVDYGDRPPPPIDDVASELKTVGRVQQRLLDLGYVDVGPVDGFMGDKTKDNIQAFRRREGLPLATKLGEPLFIDAELLAKLDTAKPKELPLEQTSATVEDIIPKVEAVKENNESIKTAWHTRLWAFITGIPAGIVAVILAIVDKFDEAVAAISPVMGMFNMIPVYVWIGGFSIIALGFAYQAHVMKGQSEKAQDKLVEGFRTGAVKNDPRPEDVRP